MKNNIVITKVKRKTIFWMVSYSTFLSSSDVKAKADGYGLKKQRKGMTGI